MRMHRSLCEYPFNVEYRTGRDDLIRDFYYPALERCSQYWRAVGFFSSSALEAIGSPMGEFIARGGTMRLITSVQLDEADVAAIERGLDQRRVCEDKLIEQIRQEFASPVGRGAELLAVLLEAGHLEITIAQPIHGRGIYHEKVGIFISDTGDFVAFSGSSNESRSGLELNYECVDVFSSWNDTERATAKRVHFESLWNNTSPGVITFEFPEAVKRELINRVRYHRNIGQSGRVETNDPWRHQEEAIEVFIRERCGILEMATGTGKTRTAMRICDLLAGSGAIGTIIVTADGNDLLDQWYKQLLQLTSSLPSRFTVHRQYENHRERSAFLLQSDRAILLTSRPNLSSTLRHLPEAQAIRTLLIHDEVHRLGSPANRQALAGLADRIPFRLGLSATPDREYDQDGNQFVEDHIGPVLFSFGLDAAIRRGILAPFNYYPLAYTPDENDRSAIQSVYAQQAARKRTANPMSQEELWIALARVYKRSQAKLPIFARFIDSEQGLLQRCIIFVEDREYGEAVLELVHRYRHDFHSYYAEDDKATLEQFANGAIECLITCHRLSEGIDIRSIQTVILFSSSRSRLETIQRIGRCLRIDPGNPSKRANVIDFIRTNESDANDNADHERQTWLQGLSVVEPEV